MKKVLIHYPFIPHYRLPVFTRLSKNKTYRIDFLADTNANSGMFLGDSSDLRIIKSKYVPFTVPFSSKKREIELGVFSLLIKREYDVYICLGSPNIITSWIYSLLAKLLGLKVFFWTHGVLSQETGAKAFVRKLYLSIADGLMLYGERAKEILSKSFDQNRLQVIYNSLDYFEQKKIKDSISAEQLEMYKKDVGFTESDLTLVCMGRLLPKLKIEQAINFINKFNEINNMKVRLHIIGDGPERENLERIANKVSTKFHGAVYDEKELAKIYLSSDASLICGVVGLAATHSLGYGIPIITHDNLDDHCPEVESIKDGLTGFYYNGSNYDSFESALFKMIKKKGSLMTNCISEVESKWNAVNQELKIIEALNKWT